MQPASEPDDGRSVVGKEGPSDGISQGWRDSVRALAKNDEDHTADTAEKPRDSTDVSGNVQSVGWRTSVLSQSQLVHEPSDAIVEATLSTLETTSPSIARSWRSFVNSGQQVLEQGQDGAPAAPPPGDVVSHEESSTSGVSNGVAYRTSSQHTVSQASSWRSLKQNLETSTSGPTIVAGRITANGLATARASTSFQSGLPEPQRIRSVSQSSALSRFGLEEQRSAGLAAGAQLAEQGSTPALAWNQDAGAHADRPDDRTASSLPQLATEESRGPPMLRSGSRVGWRNSVEILEGAADRNKPAAETLSRSVWRSITKTFTTRREGSSSSSTAARVPAAEEGFGSATMHNFRSAAMLPGDAARISAVSASGADTGGQQQPALSRSELAERAVREVDAERAAGGSSGGGSVSLEGGSSSGELRSQTSQRRLRFAQSKQLSASSGRSSSNQSFKERVASALGLGSFVRKKHSDSGQHPDAMEGGGSMPQVVQGVLKKEGTSKQLRLGLGLGDSSGDDESDFLPKGGVGGMYRAFKHGGASFVGGDITRSTLTVTNTSTTSTFAPRSQAALQETFSSGGGGYSLQTEGAGARLSLRDGSLSSVLPPGEALPPQFRISGVVPVDPAAPAAAAAAAAPTRLTLPAQAGTVPAQQPPGVEPPGLRSSAPSMTLAGAAKLATAAVQWKAAAGEGAAEKAAPAPVAPPVKARSTIKLPIITTGHWDSLVFATVWRVGRVFGFQAFNMRPTTRESPKHEFVPATIFVAADHLNQLLVKNGYVRRHRGEDTDDERFGKALFEFHSTIFYSYEMQWTKMQRLSPRPQRFTDTLREKVFSDHNVMNGLLCELALYFLIYSEAANVRFCPEAMWLIFWCMNHSYVMADLWNSGQPNRVANARERLPQLRNSFQQLLTDLQNQIGIRPADMRPEDCGKMSSILSRLNNSEVPLSDRDLLADLVSYGDGGFFMDRIITPIFYVMSYEIDHLASQGVDTAHRLGYDDFNESLTCRAIVYSLLMDLRVTPYDIASGALNDAYHSLTSLGFQGRTVIDNKFDAQVAAEWWRNRVFVKTYRERRSWWGIYRAFFRVYAFHFVIFHMMQAQAFAGWNWRAVSSAILTHAWLSWLERVANWMMTVPTPEPLQTSMTKIYDRKGFFRIDKVLATALGNGAGPAAMRSADRLENLRTRQMAGGFLGGKNSQLSLKELQAMRPERVLEIEGAPLYGLLGGLLEWLLLATVLSIAYTLQFSEGAFRQLAWNYWGFVAAGYTGLHLLHFLLTTRDGYTISLTQALHLPDYFHNFSARPQPKTWMYGDMHMNWKNFSINVFFWVLVLAMKIPFDYFVIHKPIVKPIRLLLKSKWLACKGPIYRLPGGLHVPCVGGDWILVCVRILPFILVALFDTALFYQFVVTAFGIYHGLIKLDLGVISSWEDLVREFHKSPPRWWIRCMSFTGNENQKNLLFHTISANAQAAADADGAPGDPDAAPKQNVAISDGLMFKIKIVTPEEIRAKQQGLMLKERRINMHAGKQGPSSEVEVKAAVKPAGGDKGAAGNGGGSSAASGAGGKGGSGGSMTHSGHGGGHGHGHGGKSDGRKKEVDNEHNFAIRGTRAHAALVGQDFKDGGQNKTSGPSGLFNWRSPSDEGDGINPASGPSASLFSKTHLPGAAPHSGSSTSLPAGIAARFRSRVTSGSGEHPGSTGSGTSRGGGGGGGGVVGLFKTLGNAALGAAAMSAAAHGFPRKSNQVQPEPVAESTERSTPGDQPHAAAAAGVSGGCTRAASPRSDSSAPRPHAWVAQRPRHPAWRPEELLGPDHADYDPALAAATLGEPQQQRRLWPWQQQQRQQQRQQQQPDEEAGGVVVPGPASASLLAHGWTSRCEIEACEDEEGCWSGRVVQQQRLQQQQQQQRRGWGRRVYQGPLGEAVVQPLEGESTDGGTDVADEDASETRPSPLVLLSEVPVVREDSEGNELPGDSDAEAAPPAPFVLLSEVPVVVEDSDGNELPGPGNPGVDDDGEGAGGHKSHHPEDASNRGERHGAAHPSAAAAGAKEDSDDSDKEVFRKSRRASVRFNGNNEEPSEPAAAEPESVDDPIHRNRKRLPNSSSQSRPRRSSILAGLFKRAPEAGEEGHEEGMEQSLATLRKSSMIRAAGQLGSLNLGPAAAGMEAGAHPREHKNRRASVGPGSLARKGSSLGLQRKGSSLGLQRKGSSLGLQRKGSALGLQRKASTLGLQRVRSISAANTTNFEQKQFAKKWERQHSIAAQAVKRDIAMRTTSMVLMGTDELNELEEDELDVVSEQMMMWSSFAEAWDAICDDLREGDLISDKEAALLKFVRLESSGKLYGLRPILLPTFFFAGQIRKVVDTGRVTTAQVMVLTEFRVLATWLACQVGIMSGKHAHVIMTSNLYGGIINVKHIGLRMKSFQAAIQLINLVEGAIRSREVPFDIKEFAEHLSSIMYGLESECYAVQKMWEVGRMDDDDLDGALTLFEVVRDMQERIRKDPEELKVCLKRAVAAEDLTKNNNVLLQVTTVLRQMLTTTSADATPQGEEAQRVLGFFINSLGHPSLDKPESLEFMLSWSVLTPAYEEDVLYAVEAGLLAEELGLPKKKITDLLSETDEGFSLMAYLRAMFAFEWGNFKERMRRLVADEVDIPDWGQVTELDFGPGGLLFEYRTELQLWASYRGQLLARTVRGMMCYERALKCLCRLEYPTPLGIADADYERWVDAMVAAKFEYVVAVQTYGRNARSRDLRLRQLSQGVDILVQRFPSLKVAYLDDDAASCDQLGPTQYSVLIRNRRAADPINSDPSQPINKIVEAYRIRLPRNRYSNRGVVLGEGKPENQNHAGVFAFNEGLQAIDMNQDNYLAEALKMRNLLSELHPSNKGQFMLFADDTPSQVLNPHMTGAELRFVILSRMKHSFPTAIVGFREWIFSANSGALGQYAAATEYSFATIQSRIMTKPPRVRMHYGHPDVFNKTHIMTRGGMSKGTRTLHISEDYFIGAAHTLRGARIRYKEYISCGKGRDMGFDSILGYQKKISGGAGDLATSREVHRLGTRLDFFRLMSFYHGGIGHFLNSFLTLKAAWYNIWALLLTALAGAMEMGLAGDKGEVTLTQTYNVQQVLQLGTLSIIPYVGQLILETGLLRTLIVVFGQIVTGSLFFYIFQQQTVAASFSSVMAYGGMRYIGTGRGFSIQTTDFVKMYTMYSRSHLYMGFEVLFFCATVYSLHDCQQCNYAALTWNSWMLAFVMILCPLWFNPFIFNLSKVQRDYMSWKRWLSGDMDPGTGTNWYTWNREQLSKARNDDGNVTDAWRNGFGEIVGVCLPYLLLVLAVVSRIDFRISHVRVLDNPYMEFLLATALLWVVTLSMSYLGHNLLERAASKEWRIVRYVASLTVTMLFIVYLAALNRFYTGSGFRYLSEVGYANLMILIMVHKAATYLFTQNNTVRDFVDAGYYLIDVLVGFFMFSILALLSFVGFVNLLQSKLLFNEAFSQSVQTARIRMQVKRSGKQIKRKTKPGLLMTMEEWMRSRPGSAASVAPSVAPTAYEGRSIAPSMAASIGPSAAPSLAASAFPSRANSVHEGLDDAVRGVLERVRQGQRGLGDEEAAAGETGGGGGGGSGDGAGVEGAGENDGLRERRLRLGAR